jgi:Zn-dependent protease with chaperone function
MLKLDALKLGDSLLREQALAGWSFGFHASAFKAGFCRHETRTISVSTRLVELNDVAHIREVILHEIAHALLGDTHHHDEVWRLKAVELGASGSECLPTDFVCD